MKNKITSIMITAMILISLLSPVVTASIVYGPVKVDRIGRGPDYTIDNFSIDDFNTNHTLFIENGDGVNNLSSSSLVFLNGNQIFKTNDFSQKANLLQRQIEVLPINELEIEMRGIPGSYITHWIEDESPWIIINSPFDDTASNESIIVSGTADILITSDITLTHNGDSFTLPLENGHFSTIVDLVDINNITITAVDRIGRIRSATLLLDGDMLPESHEQILGFDPQNPDSDSTLTPENEAGNGIPDGIETLGDQLPMFVKSRIGADPFTEDTDDDGLSDYFELMGLGLMTDVKSVDSNNDGIPDADEDPDNDKLSNLQEQTYGTDPLISDTDEDSLEDGFEVNLGMDPLTNDTDGDGLEDDSELRLGTDPLNPDTDGDEIPDGDEIYISTNSDDDLGVEVSITGVGDLAKELKINDINSEIFTNISCLVGPVIDFNLDDSFESAQITLPYDPSKVDDPSQLSIFYFDETLGTFVEIESTIDPVNHKVTGSTSHFSTFAIFYVPNWNAIFETEMNLGRGGADVTYVDAMFTMDSSGSMSWNDPYGYRKTAAKSFVGALITGDQAGVVDFDGSARLIRPLTDDFNAVNASINSLDSSGGTNIGAGVGTANNHLISSGDPEHGRMMILLTDGQGSYNSYYTQQAAANNITIYTIGLGSSVDSGLLTGIATATGGQYYPVASADQLPEVFRDISGVIEPTDTDGDGLPDVTETEGFRDGLGHGYETDPNDPDSDGDGLSDGEEAGELVEVDGRTFFKLLSDPTLVDSDSDGINDPDEAEFGTSPLNDDCDDDELFDGYELEIGTDPLVSDTDYDGFDDKVENNDPDHDPLVYEKRYSTLEIGRELVLGAILGEWGADDHDSLYYMSGWMLSGFVVVGDVRDIAASIWNGDGLGMLLNALALIPLGGDALKVGETISTFSAKHPHMLFTVAGFVTKHVDDSIDTLKYVYDDDFLKRLNSKGFSDDVIVTLSKQNINLKRFDN
ncbi:MAG TPA: VWA domain-containing protein, partial [Methanosarcinaceae archaeon]|nr:VWA domain-containing protein [Methanosarcinaceae archaeon]